MSSSLAIALLLSLRLCVCERWTVIVREHPPFLASELVRSTAYHPTNQLIKLKQPNLSDQFYYPLFCVVSRVLQLFPQPMVSCDVSCERFCSIYWYFCRYWLPPTRGVGGLGGVAFIDSASW